MGFGGGSAPPAPAPAPVAAPVVQKPVLTIDPPGETQTTPDARTDLDKRRRAGGAGAKGSATLLTGKSDTLG